MTTETGEHPEGEEQGGYTPEKQAPVTSVEMLAERLGFAAELPANLPFPLAGAIEGGKFFSRHAVPSLFRLTPAEEKSPGALHLVSRTVVDSQTGQPEDRLSVFSQEDPADKAKPAINISEKDLMLPYEYTPDPKAMTWLAPRNIFMPFPKEAGYQEIYNKLSQWLLPADPLKTTIGVEAVHAQVRSLDSEGYLDEVYGQIDKDLFFEDETTDSFEKVVEQFKAAFPDYHLESVDGNVSLVKAPERRGWVLSISLEEGQRGFSIQAGKDSTTVSPLFRSQNPNLDRQWDFWEVEEAVEVVKLREKPLEITNNLLSQAVSWDEQNDKPFTFFDLLRDQTGRGLVTDKRLKALKGLGGPMVRRVQRLTWDEFTKLTQARLEVSAEETVEINGGVVLPRVAAIAEVTANTKVGRKIMRRQFREIETQLAQIQMEDFTISKDMQAALNLLV